MAKKINELIRKFQSHSGSIKTEISKRYLLRSPIFQSHSGSIKTAQIKRKRNKINNFNPTLVRLKQHILCCKIQLPLDFNPTLVRLKLLSWALRSEISSFQSHSGSIKTRTSTWAADHVMSYFNPTLVRLKPTNN